MNPVKYRIWDQISENMYYSSNDVDDLLLGPDGDVYSFEEDEKDSWSGDLSVKNYRFIAMLCTGIDDRNYKLIYDGDIIRSGNERATPVERVLE